LPLTYWLAKSGWLSHLQAETFPPCGRQQE